MAATDFPAPERVPRSRLVTATVVALVTMGIVGLFVIDLTMQSIDSLFKRAPAPDSLGYLFWASVVLFGLCGAALSYLVMKRRREWAGFGAWTGAGAASALVYAYLHQRMGGAYPVIELVIALGLVGIVGALLLKTLRSESRAQGKMSS